MEDYLTAIYHVQAANNGGRVRTSTVAEYLDVAPPTATSMFSRLAAEDVIEYEKYKGAMLAADGERIASRLVRNRRLIETYLTSELGYRASEAHEEAHRLEHHVSDRLADRLADAVRETAPDWSDPFPRSSLEPFGHRRGEPLPAFAAGDAVRVREIDDPNGDLSEQLAEYAVRPGSVLSVAETGPFETVTVYPEDSDRPVPLPADVARSVWVTTIDATP